MDVRFVIIAPAPARKAFKVRLPVVVGRGDEAKFRIQQDSVSRQHCRFALDGAVVTVTDLGSTNGTHVAGARIAAHAATAVPSGAEVRIGGTVVRVEYAAAAAAPRKPAPAAPHEADTVPLLPAAAAADELAVELPEPEPAAELEPAGETTAAHAVAESAAGAPASPDLAGVDAPAAADGPPDFSELEAPAPAATASGFPDLEPAPPPAGGSFDFFETAAAPPPATDGGLDDFFKGQS